MKRPVHFLKVLSRNNMCDFNVSYMVDNRPTLSLTWPNYPNRVHTIPNS